MSTRHRDRGLDRLALADATPGELDFQLGCGPNGRRKGRLAARRKTSP
jgi:hypothetical protein